ncbi:MAG: type IV secretion system protein, partial [Rickettsiales bacterium]|nr:type IV secretion system protein [Rickettsiales bacterium]
MFIVLVSCDGRGCIEADDFGEWDKVSFKVLSRNDICGIDTTGGSLVGDERVEICLGVGRSTDATKRISGGTKFSSLSRERCDLTISKDSTYNDIFNILSLSEDERRAKYTTDVSFSDNCGSSPIARTKILQEFFDNGLAECITECNANDTADTTYNYDRYEPGWRMMDVGNIKIGEGQSMDIRVKGKITLQPLMEKKYSFDAKENGLQISDLYLDSGVLFSVTTNVSDSEDFPYEDVKKRINSLRRAVVYVKNLPHNAVVDYLGNYYGPSLSFDSIKDNYISCVNGYCAVSCNTNCGMQKTTNESYYSFSDATSIDIVGQVVVPDNYNFITSQPFKTDGTIDDSKNAVPKAYTLNSDEPKVFKSEYPYKIMYNAPIGCSLNVDGNNNSLSTNKDWSFIMDGNTHKIYNYDSIKSSSSAKSVSFSRNGCTGNIKVLFVPLNFVKFQTSGFVEFKNFSSGTSSAQFSYKILNPEVIGVAGKESHIEETSSKIDVSSSAWTKSVSGKLIYVRKGQVMLFEESNWFFEGSNGSTPNGTLIEKPNDFRNLVITVTPRPALLCKGFAEEKFDNPSCKKMADPSGEFYCKKEYEEICKGDRNDGSCLLSDGKYDEDCDKPDMCNSGGGKYEKCNGLNIPPDSPKTIKEGNFSSKRRGANIMVCPGGCYKKQVDGEAMEGENWSDIFSEKEVNYQIYFVDVKEKEMNDITRQNLCPYPLRDDGGNLIYSYNDEGKPAPNIVLESCEICSKNVLNIEPEISVPGIVQCYDLENYIGKVSSFDPKTVGTDDAMGAVKIGNINGRTGNYFSLESLVLDSSKKDINGAYTEFLYTSGTTALPVSSLSSIQFLSLRHDDNFDFSSETESSVSGDYTLSYSVAKAFDGGEQMAIVVADKDWDRKSNAYQHIIKYNLDKSNSAGYGDFINDTGYKIVNGRLVSDNGQLQYVFDSVLFNDLSGFKYENLRLFFKIIDKKYASESTCRNDQEVYADVTYYKCPNTDFSEEYPSTAVDGVYVKGCGFEATTKLYSLVKDPVGGNGVAFCSTVNGYNVEYGKDNKCHYTLPDSDTSKTKTKDKAFLYEPRKELKTVRPTWIIDLSGKESSNGSARCPASYSYEGVTYTNSDINNVPSVSGVNVTCNYNTPRCVDKGDMRCDSSCHTNSEFCYRRSICPDKGGSYKDVESEVDSASKIDYIYGKIPETNRMFKEDYCYYLERTCPSFEIDPNTKDIGTCVDHGTQWLRKSGRSTYNKSVSVDREVLYEDRTVLKPRAKELLDLREIGGDGLVVTVANAENASGFSGSGNLILRYESGGKDVEDCSAVHSDYEHSHKYYDESTDKYYCIFLKKTAKCPTTYKFNNVTYTNTNNGGIPNSSKDSGIICNYVQTTCPDDGNNVCNDLCHTNNQFCYSKPCDTSTKTGNNNTSYVYVAGNNANNNAIISYIYGKIPTGNRMAKDSYCYYIEESCPNFDLLNSGDSVYTTCSISANSQKWVRTAAVVDSSIDYNKPIEVQTRVGNGGVCYDMYKENIGDYFVTLKAQRNFRERSSGSNAELLDTNKMTYMTSSASGLIIKYIILPTLEAFEGKNMQIMTTVGSTDTNLQYVRCGDGNPARDDCVKFRGGGWRIGCTGGDNLCYEITTGVNAAAPQLVPCTDDTVGLTGQCAIFTGDNSYGPVCKSGDANCVNLCQSNVFTNACGVYTSVMDNDSMALDDTFGLKCNDSGDPGCYRDCSKLNSEQKYAQCRVVNNNGGFVKRFYIKTITSSFYQTILKNLLVIMFTFYGLLSLAGMTKINNKELMNITVKIGIIYLFVGSSGWFYYEKFVVRFFTDGVTWMTYALTSAFDQTGDVALAFKANDFTDRSILFSSFEKNISLLFSAETTYKVFGLLFVSFFGWLYVMLIYSAFVTYVFASITIIVEYICAQLMITILLGFGPVFLCFLLFNKTKKMFDKWINNILGIALEQILTITDLSFFNIVFYMSIKAALSYRVC